MISPPRVYRLVVIITAEADVELLWSLCTTVRKDEIAPIESGASITVEDRGLLCLCRWKILGLHPCPKRDHGFLETEIFICVYNIFSVGHSTRLVIRPLHRCVAPTVSSYIAVTEM